ASSVSCIGLCGVTASPRELTSYQALFKGTDVPTEIITFANTNRDPSDENPNTVYFLQFTESDGRLQGAGWPGPGFDISTIAAEPNSGYGWSIPVGGTIGRAVPVGVPEPGTLGLFALALTCFGLFRDPRRGELRHSS